MENSKVFRPVNASNRLAVLVEFGHRVGLETHLNPLLELIAEGVRQILDADRCSLFLLDKEKQELWSRIAHGLEGQVLRFPRNKGIIGHVAETLRAINVENIRESQYFNPEADAQSGYQTKSVLAMPMKDRNGELLGVFQVLNKKTGSFNQEDEGLLAMLCSLASTAIENAQLYGKIRKSHLETILRLAMAAESRDQEDLAGHLRRMSRYSAIIAEVMGLPPEDVEDILYASPLHDIGKIAIPDRVLLKPGRLNEEETEIMHQHATHGAKILENAKSSVLQKAYNIAYAHHERYDGKGYPRKLSGDEIPLEARIVSLADVFDALTSKRVYKPGWSLDETLDYIRAQSGTQFDPNVVTVFFRGLPEIEKILRSGLN